MNQSQHDNQINIIRRNKMKTTLNEIKSKSPCGSGWRKLLASLDKTEADDDPIELMYILKSNGIQDAVWALRCFDFKDCCLFLADVAESVLPIYEKRGKSKAPREAIKIIRDYHAGNATRDDLKNAAYAAADTAAYAAAYAAARNKKWAEIESLFIKHFGG